MLLAAWLLAFLAGAYLKLELGSYLAKQWTNYPAAFSEMAAFGLIYVGILLAAPIVIVIVTRGSQRVSPLPGARRLRSVRSSRCSSPCWASPA